MLRYGGLRRPRGVALASVAVLVTLVCAGPASAEDIRSQEWFLDRVHAEQAWAITKGQGITVAVVDSGVEASHPDLSGQVLPGADVGDGRSPQGEVDTDTKSNGHGTAMASLIAGTAVNGGGQGVLGLAPASRILPIYDHFGSNPSSVAMAQGIEYAISHGAAIINVSGSVNSDDIGLRRVMEDADAHNVIVVAASGNDAQHGNPVGYPAAYPGVVTVASTDRADQPAAFSQWGPTVALAAPGVDIVTAASHAGYARGGGTSDSTALVSAAAALVRAHFPNLTAGQVINRLIRTADHPAGGRDEHVGYGIVNPLKALTADIPAGPPGNPLLDGAQSSQQSGQQSGQPSSQPSVDRSAATPVSAPSGGRGRGVTVIAGLTLAFLVVVATLVTVVVGRRRRRQRNRPPWPG